MKFKFVKNIFLTNFKNKNYHVDHNIFYDYFYLNNFRVPLELMEQEVRALRMGVQRLEKQIQHAPDDIKIQFSGKTKNNLKSIEDFFVFLAYIDFVNGALTASEELSSHLEAIQAVAKKLARHFCEDEDKFQLNECFSLFSDFLLKTQNTIKVCNCGQLFVRK